MDAKQITKMYKYSRNFRHWSNLTKTKRWLINFGNGCKAVELPKEDWYKFIRDKYYEENPGVLKWFRHKRRRQKQRKREAINLIFINPENVRII